MKGKLSIAAIGLLLLTGCAVTSALQEGEYILRRNTIVSSDASYNPSQLNSYLSQKPNTYTRKIGEAPVIYDASKVEETVKNFENHLRYTGYYSSSVSSEVSVKGRNVYVTYHVNPGRRYMISSITYDIPTYGTFADDFNRDRENVSIKPGQFLSEEALEKEAARSAEYFRTIGYYGFAKSYYAFEADTLFTPAGRVNLKYSIRDYALGDTPDAAREHRKYTLGKITISHPQNLKIRKDVLENLNMLRPGQLYDEREINTTYSRFASVNMLSGVNINLEPVEGDKLDCNIILRNSGLQGFKINLEGSVNSTGLFGISPQLNYYHKNVFHGGEMLSLGLKGNFQFRTQDDAYSTEFSITSGLRFPKALGLPNSLFKGPYIPRTDLNLSYSYQDRPEYRRTMIASSISYTGRWGSRISYQISPVQANIVKLSDTDPDFFNSIMLTNPFIMSAYMDHVDLGVGGNFLFNGDDRYYRLGLDLSGNVISLFNNLLPQNEYGERTIWDTPYSQYVRGDFHTARTFRFGKDERHSIALHLAAGAGYAYGNTLSLPVEKQFYAGGAMSMRGWQARTLGPGSSEMITVFAIPSQIGDMHLEVNAEYRFPMFWKLEGALFTDIGNIWDIRSDIPEATFQISDFYKQLGADVGFGIRLNLDLILVRLDTGFKVHDPARADGSRWVSPLTWFSGNNSAVHFGVGYPF